MPPPARTRALEHDLADLRQDFEQLLVAFRAARTRIYALEGELRELRHYVEDLEAELTRKQRA
jgi:chromosome segregation ATPase